MEKTRPAAAAEAAAKAPVKRSLPSVSLPHVSLPHVSVPHLSMPHLGGKTRKKKRSVAAKTTKVDPTGSRSPKARSNAKAPARRAASDRRRLAARFSWMPLVGHRSEGGSNPKRDPKKVKGPRPAKAPASPATRRRRIPVAVAGLFAVVLLATSFPFTALLSQHQQLAAASSELRQTTASNRALTERERQLNSKAAIARLAREEYQLVSPGQTLYDVLPANGVRAAAGTGLVSSGDPGSQPLVTPANAPDLSPQPDLSSPTPVSAPASSAGTSPAPGTTAQASGTTTPSAPSSFWGRVTNTLEFWK